MVHNYRRRLGVTDGKAKFDNLEKRLAEAPVITVPTITLEGDANSAPHPGLSAYAKKFFGRYEHRLITGGIGHNLPQKAPKAFADAFVDLCLAEDAYFLRVRLNISMPSIEPKVAQSWWMKHTRRVHTRKRRALTLTL